MTAAVQVAVALGLLYVALTPGLVRRLAVWLGFVDSRPARDVPRGGPVGSDLTAAVRSAGRGDAPAGPALPLHVPPGAEAGAGLARTPGVQSPGPVRPAADGTGALARRRVPSAVLDGLRPAPARGGPGAGRSRRAVRDRRGLPDSAMEEASE